MTPGYRRSEGGSTSARALLLAVATVVAFGAPARAASDAETLVAGWLDQIRAAGAKVETGAIVYTAAEDRLEIRDLVIIPPGKDGKGDGAIRVPSTTAVGLSAGPNGAISVKALAIGGVEGGSDDRTVTFSLAAVEGRDLVVPGLKDLRYDPNDPFGSQIELGRRLASARIGGLTVGRLAAHVKLDDGPLDFAYDGLAIAGLADARLAKATSGAMTMTGPSKDGPVDVRIGTIELTGYDFGAYLKVVDDKAYTGGKGDGVWRTVQGSAVLNGLGVTAGPVKVSLARLSTTDVRVRQFDTAPGDLFARLAKDPNAVPEAEQIRFGIDMVRAFSIGAYTLEGFSVTAPEVDVGIVGRIKLADAGPDGIGEFSIDGAAVKTREGGFELGRFALGKIEFPAYADVLKAIEADHTPGGKADIRSITPTVGHLGIDGLVVDVPGKGRLQLGAVSVDLDRFIRAIPTSAVVALRRLVIPSTFSDTPEERDGLKKLGYDRLDLSGDVAIAWDEKTGDLDVRTVTLSAADAGELSVSATFGGIPRAVFEKPEEAQIALATATVKRYAATYRDASLMRRGLSVTADLRGKTVDAMRAEILGHVAVALSELPDPDLRRRVQDALTTFVTAPKAIRVLSRLATPVPVTQLIGVGATAPQQIPGLLKLDVEAER